MKKEDFWNYVDKKEDDECWEWTGSKGAGKWKYGHGYINRKAFIAHRIAWELINGDIPRGKLVLHKCDNPPCCNPAHLYAGTQQDNMRDRDMRGRGHRGERHHRATLREKQVVRIRELFRSNNYSNRELAEMFNVSRDAIYKVVKNKTWKHVR